MAAKFYQKWAEAVLSGGSNVALSGTVKACAVNSTYTFTQTDDFLDDIDSGERVAISGALASKTYTNGVFDAADTVLSAVNNGTITGVIIFIDTGVESTSRLVAFIDGLSQVTNGGDITLNWDDSPDGIFKMFED